MTDAAHLFDAHASRYEAERRRLIPPYDAFYSTAIAALGLSGRRLHRILDLGAGTGLVAQMVADEHPQANLTLLDAAPAMLAEARAVLGERTEYITANLTSPLPDGPWDAVVSALAIHHLDDRDKSDLFCRVHAALAPGGIFVNAEQVAGPTALFDDAYALWHARRAQELGATDAQWGASQTRMRQDRTASVERHLAWLREASFADADCLFKDHNFAVVAARRAG